MTYLLGIKMKKLTLAFLFLFGALNVAQAGCIPDAPNPPKLVNDFANIIDVGYEGRIELYLSRFNDTTSTQITVVTVDDLCGYTAAEFAYEIGESWGVGNKEFDNGVVILIKPKLPDSKGEAFIAPGYGLEGAIPDAMAKRIIENEMIPYFKEGKYSVGIVEAVKVIVSLTEGEYSANNANRKKRPKRSKAPVAAIFFVLFVAFVMIFGTINRARRYGRKNNLGLWTALWLMGSMNSRHRGRYNDFTSGRGGFGGFGGGSGGFGGFGGGSFGGGGAGGSW